MKCGGRSSDGGAVGLAHGRIKTEKISCQSHGIRAALFWNIISAGNCCTYRVYESDTIIHESFVIHRCYKFPFLGKNDIEIGPCRTHEQWRGKGIYPSVLTAILENELSEDDRAYMIIESDNRASINGVIKAGYTRISCLKKTKFLKIYRILK